MKSFEDKFSDNVKEVFENYSEELDQKAFKDMQNLLRKKSRKKVAFLYSYRTWAAAAAILLMLGGSLYFSLKIEDIGSSDSELRTQDSELRTQDSELRTQDLGLRTQNSGLRTQDSGLRTQDSGLSIIEEQKTEYTNVEIIVDNDFPEDVKEIILPTVKQISDTYTLDISENPYNYENVKKEKISALNITAGSMIPFAEMQITNGYGFAAGVMNDWNITPFLSVSTGGLFVYNKFSYDSSSRNLFRAEYDNLTMDGGQYSVNTVKDFEIFAIDIPVNAKVDLFNYAGTKLYITTGVSSLIYLHQTYSEQGTVSGNYLETDPLTNAEYLMNFSDEISINEEVAAFEHFDLAGLLNFSVGYQKKRNKHSIIIEPFVKLPISNLTSKNIKMGMGGILLKISL